MNQVLIAIIAVIVAPFIGGLLAGIDRKVTARLQGAICSNSLNMKK
jgi:ech hydrogenase subunit B